MKRFLASAWFPLSISTVLAASAVLAYAVLPVLPNDVSNSQLLNAFVIVGWAAGPVMGIVSLLLMGILNILRRIVRARKVIWLHPVVVLLGLSPWCVFGWILLFEEPRHTPFAILMIDVVGRQMFVGSMIAFLLTLLFGLMIFLPSRRA